jgi:hypothetical protein
MSVNATKESKREWYLQRTYGIGLRDCADMLDMQGGTCPICLHRIDDTLGAKGARGLCVDHCHDNGHVRGILCNHCNRALGLLDDNIEALQRAVEYLK